MSTNKRKLAPGNCSHCGANEMQTSLWRTNPINRERLCNACGLYVQTHGRPRPIGHFAGKKRVLPSGPAPAASSAPANATASSSRRDSDQIVKPTRIRVPAAQKAATESSLSGSGSSEEESSESSDDSPNITKAAPKAARGLPRQPRQPHAEPVATTSKPRAPRPPPKARSPPPVPVVRPRSAPPTKPAGSKASSKRKSKKTNSPSLDIFLADKAQTAVAPDVAFLRQAAPVSRERATDVMIGGKMHRLPEQSIKLDFWTKALGLHAGPSVEATQRGAASLPSFSPRQTLLTPPSNISTPNISPSLSIENTFGTSGGDFGHLGRSSSGKKRSRIRLDDPAYDGPLFGQSSKASGSGGLSGGIGGMQIGQRGSSPSQVPSPNKRPRSESKSPNTSPTLSNAAVQVLLPSSTNHLSPAGNLPRASSPLRTSFTLPMPGAPHVYSRSQLGTELVMGAQPSGVSPVGVSPVGTPMEGMVAGPIGS